MGHRQGTKTLGLGEGAHPAHQALVQCWRVSVVARKGFLSLDHADGGLQRSSGTDGIVANAGGRR